MCRPDHICQSYIVARRLAAYRTDLEAGAVDAAVRVPDQQSVIRGDALRAFRATVLYAVDRQRVE